jgi:hypothetical protein
LTRPYPGSLEKLLQEAATKINDQEKQLSQLRRSSASSLPATSVDNFHTPSTPTAFSSSGTTHSNTGPLAAPPITLRDEWCTTVGLDIVGSTEGISDPLATTIQSLAAMTRKDGTIDYNQLQYNPPLDTHPANFDTLFASIAVMPESQNTGPSPHFYSSPIHEAWPQYLPPPELLMHLVDTFFTCLPHAGRLLHRGKFMNALTYPPNAPQFPLPGKLSLVILKFRHLIVLLSYQSSSSCYLRCCIVLYCCN